MLGALVPHVMPAFLVMVDDLGNPPACELASVLGVSVRTVQRWTSDNCAPRAAMLALFWCTRWGRSALDCAAVNDARLQAQIARAHESESADRLAQVEHLLQLGQFGSANSPLEVYAVATPTPTALQSAQRAPTASAIDLAPDRKAARLR